MKRILAATTLAAVLLFFWGFVFWTVLEPTVGVFRAAPDEAALGQALKAHLSEEGTYFLPMDTSNMDAWTARHEDGPLATIMFRPQGAPPMAPSVLGAGFVHMWVSILMMAFLVRWIARFLGSFRQRFLLVAWIGAIEAVFANLGRPIWYFQPWDYHVLQAVYALSAWALVGLVLAWFLHGDT